MSESTIEFGGKVYERTKLPYNIIKLIEGLKEQLEDPCVSFTHTDGHKDYDKETTYHKDTHVDTGSKGSCTRHTDNYVRGVGHNDVTKG